MDFLFPARLFHFRKEQLIANSYFATRPSYVHTASLTAWRFYFLFVSYLSLSKVMRLVFCLSFVFSCLSLFLSLSLGRYESFFFGVFSFSFALRSTRGKVTVITLHGWHPARVKYAKYRPQACARGVFLSQASRAFYPQKKLSTQINNSLVSAHEGKNRRKYIRFEHL